MWILGFSLTHDASVTLLKDDEVVLHVQEERITHRKYDAAPLNALKKIKDYTDTVDYCAYTFLDSENNSAVETYYKYITQILEIEIKKVVNLSKDHHLLHAMCGFVHSGFNEASVLVMDSGGATVAPDQYEVESIFHFSKPNNYKLLYQQWSGNGFIGAGQVYSAITSHLGWDQLHCGKTMGLFSYGKENTKVKRLISERGGISSLFCHNPIYKKGIGFSLRESLGLSNISKEDLAYRVQKDFEEYILNFFTKALELSDSKNFVWTGGCALNCVTNFKLKKSLPEDINLYIEPLSSDCGVSLGAAYFCRMLAEGGGLPLDKKSISTLYLGEKLKYDYQLFPEEIETVVTPHDVSKLIVDGNIVAIAQGRSESGPRALGNRSILFDPRNPKGKDIVNTVKGRESFRPFAGTVLLEEVNNWFDMGGLDESPNMMYTVDVLSPEKIPAITHVDGTCRIQTLKKENNQNYYNLIMEFYKLTGVPILFNTSFNKAGDTIVDTIHDAFNTLRSSDIEYLYLPEIGKLIYVPNE